MLGMPDMTTTSLAAAVTPNTGKIIKNGLRVFESGEYLLPYGILHFVFKLSQSSEIVVRIYTDEKRTFLKRVKQIFGILETDPFS